MEALAHRSRKLTTPQQTALRVVNEGKSIPERIKFHERMQKESSALGPGKVRHRQKALLLKAAGRYVVHDEKGVPSLKPIASAAGRHERGALRRLHEAQANIEQVADGSASIGCRCSATSAKAGSKQDCTGPAASSKGQRSSGRRRVRGASSRCASIRAGRRRSRVRGARRKLRRGSRRSTRSTTRSSGA
jgi:hypothetical protein